MIAAAVAVLASTSAFAENDTVKNSNVYLGYETALDSHQPQIGYRYQNGHLGIDASLGGNYFQDLGGNVTVGTDLLYFINPNTQSQVYLGVGANNSYVNVNKGKDSYQLAPKAILGVDYSIFENQKIFAQTSYNAGRLKVNSDSNDWAWKNTLGFKLGYSLGF